MAHAKRSRPDGGASAAQRSSDVPAPGDLRKWLSDHITYPSQARVYGTQGTVLLRFRVLSNGKLDSAEVLNNAAAELGAKALSALRETPLSVTKAFIPKNKRLILPVHFGIDQAKEERFRDLEQGSEVLPGISVVVPSIGTRPGAVTFDESRQDPALTVVDMTDLSVTEMPANLSGLSHVSKVILQNNKLQTISPEIGKLTGLTELYLSNNLINALPVSLANLQSLRLIALANNKLTEFPSVLFALSKLEVIHVGGNQIPTLPPAINLLTKLESLYLQNNKLQTLPEEVFQLPKLKLLHLGGNPLSDAERKRIKERLPKVDVRF
jgi:TonB family protein